MDAKFLRLVLSKKKTPSDNFRGAKLGMRIPLWSKRNSVKQAKAQKIFCGGF